MAYPLQPCAQTIPPGSAWLAEHTHSPIDAYERWASGELALVRTTAWSVVETHNVIQAVDALLALRRTGRPGPVLAYPEGNRVWWLLPPGQAATLDDFPGLTARPATWALPCPPADEPLCGHGWLEKPDGTGRLTHPAHLCAAFDSARPDRGAAPAPTRPPGHPLHQTPTKATA